MTARTAGGLRGQLDSVPLAPLACLLALSAAALVVVFLSTRQGIGLRDDSFHYFTAAEGLVTGQGYGRTNAAGEWTPLTNFPPGYSALLAGLHLAGLELAAAARLINGLALAALMSLVGLSVFAATNRPWLGVVIGGLALLSPSLIEVYAWAHSEPVYLALMAGGVLVMAGALHQSHDNRLQWPAAGLLLAAAALTRYVGAAAWLVALTAIVLTRRSRGRTSDKLPLASVGLLPALGLGMFVVRNWLVSGGLANRPAPYWHPPEAANLAQGGATVLGWLLPSAWLPSMPPTLLGAVLLLLAGLAAPLVALRLANSVNAARQPQLPIRAGIIGLHGSHALVYAGLLIVSLLFFDRLTALDSRILSPILVSLLVLLGAGLGAAMDRAKPKGQRLLLLAVLVLVGLTAFAGWSTLRQRAAESLGFNSPVWRSSLAMEVVASLPERPVYTNNVAAFYFLAQRSVASIPIRTDPASGQPRSDYLAQLAAMHADLQATSGYLILLGWPPEGRVEPDQLADLTAHMDLLERTRDGLIYCYCQGD